MKIVNCVKEIWRKHTNVTIGLVGIPRRGVGERDFEHERERAENIWGEEIFRWQAERVKNKRPDRWMEGIEFISMGRVIQSKDVGRDGVHLSRFGYKKFYDRIASYLEVTKGLRARAREEKEKKANRVGKRMNGPTERTNTWVREGGKENQGGLNLLEENQLRREVVGQEFARPGVEPREGKKRTHL